MKQPLDGSRDGRRLLRHLPSWFRVVRYRAVQRFGAVDWYGQITLRQVCHSHLLRMRKPGEPDTILQAWNDAVREALTRMRENPICDLNHAPYDHEAFSFCRNVGFPQVPVVRSMTLEDLYSTNWLVQRNLQPHQIAQAQQMASNKSSSSILRFLFCPEWMSAKVDDECLGHGYMPIMINLDFPNHLLAKHFMRHVQELRCSSKGKSKESGKKSPDLKTWERTGLLPCMDLLLWAEENRSRIPDSMIANALAPEVDLDEEQVRKTLRPLATELLKPMGDSTADDRLRALAFVEWSRLQKRGRSHS
jgi:hypothetical protein